MLLGGELTIICPDLVHVSGDSPQNDTKGGHNRSPYERTRAKRLARLLLPYQATLKTTPQMRDRGFYDQ